MAQHAGYSRPLLQYLNPNKQIGSGNSRKAQLEIAKLYRKVIIS